MNIEMDLDIKLDRSFSTLNFWRKFYVVFQWAGAVILSGLLVFVGVVSEDIDLLVVILLSFLIIGFAYWNHVAIVSRNLDQITLLTILNLVPLSNLIGCLIMFSIRRVTKNELADYD